MGHANIENLSTFFLRRLYAEGKLSVCETADAALSAGEILHASEGDIVEPAMIRYALELVVRHLSGRFDHEYIPRQSDRVIEPDLDTPEKVEVYRRWLANDEDDWDMDSEGGEYGVFDSIRWRFAKGWRQKYPDAIPVLGAISN